MGIGIDNRQQIIIASGAFTLLILLIVAFATEPIYIIFELSTILFLHGYALFLVLFPRQDDLNSIKRSVLSFGLSLTTINIIRLVLNFTLFGIHFYSILTSINLLIILALAMTYYHEWKLPKADRLHFTSGIRLPD